MRDTIYRDDAIRVASGYCHPSNIAKELERLPSAQPERKTGRWILEPGIGCKCSQCEFDIGNDLDWMEYVNYCPNCGAPMRRHKEIPTHCGPKEVREGHKNDN